MSETYAWPEPLDLHALAMREPEPPKFIVADWLPSDCATLIAGHGGVGKSGIALHLAACIALGRPWFGKACEQRRVMYLSCEDHWPVLHWRLARIAAHMGIDIGHDLTDKLDVLDLVGVDSVLWERDPATGMTLTQGFTQLDRRMESTGAQVLIVDGAADVFGGNENSRNDVKRFINALLSLIPPDGALVLIGHVNRTTAGTGATSEGYSGSTGWHNAVRSRWYLRPETDTDDDGNRSQRTGRLVLELQKSNHGPTAAAIGFTWDEAAHMFIGRPEDSAPGMAETIRDSAERDAILRALHAATTAGIHVPAATMGRRTAYHVLSAQPSFPDSLRSGKPAVRRFWRHIEALRAMPHVEEGSITRKDRHSIVTLVLTQEGMRACGQ